ncbi:hypothetical protein Tco_0180816 [Tanacetum coccineum]
MLESSQPSSTVVGLKMKKAVLNLSLVPQAFYKPFQKRDVKRGSLSDTIADGIVIHLRLGNWRETKIGEETSEPQSSRLLEVLDSSSKHGISPSRFCAV